MLSGIYCISAKSSIVFIIGKVVIIWEKGKSSRSIAFIGKIAALVLLKLFINGNEKCHPSDQWLRLAHKQTLFANQNNFSWNLNMSCNILHILSTVSSLGFFIVLGLAWHEFIKFIIWMLFVDCIGVGIFIATVLW